MFVSPTDPVTQGLIQMPGLETPRFRARAVFPSAAGTPSSWGTIWRGPRDGTRCGSEANTHIQSNVAYGADAQAVEQLAFSTQDSMNDLINTGGNPAAASWLASRPGSILRANSCATRISMGNLIHAPSCAVTPPLSPAAYARSYRYNDWALYAQDSFKVTPR